MLKLLETELRSHGALDITSLPPAITFVANSLPKMEITDKMRLMIAKSEIVLYAGMFNRNMSLWNDSNIPINSISFIVSASGTGKDKAARGIRKCFDDGYTIINHQREEIARSRAIRAASEAGSDQPYHPDEWKQYYKPPESLFASASSTVKGLHGHFNRLEDEGLGAGYITSMEIGSALETGKDITELIEFISEVYDQGTKEVKLIGNKEEQLRPLHNFPVTALFGGSEANILYDYNIKKKFKMQFTSKLARRTDFNFNPLVPDLPNFTSIKELTDYKAKLNAEAKSTRDLVSQAIVDVTNYHLSKTGKPILVTKDVEDLYNVYMEYNKHIANETPKLYPISIIARQHQHWRALKLAGALAIFACQDEITITDFVHAINFTELMSSDLALFERELEKEPYELFSDFMRSQAIGGKSTMSIHELRKRGYLTAQSSKARLQELIINASSYDQDGIYTLCDDGGICYEQIVRTPINGVSFLPVSGTKDQRARQCATGFQYHETTFDQLAEMLRGDYAYTPFEFRNGIRSKENIISGAKWIALDIDSSKLSASDMHVILADINHHIALTSDPNNDFKYRLLLELDQFVDLNDMAWKAFTKSIADDLHITIDNLPKSQIFFSYSAEHVYSVTDAEPLSTRDHILVALNQSTPKPKLSPNEAKAALKDPMGTFHWAYDAPSGQGVKSLIRVAFEANEMGASKDEIISILDDINSFWIYPLPQDRMESQVYTVINRF
jgi:hypothetical protein